MATVDKNFRIKNGLVVEGTIATVNGKDILTKDAGDSYIISLIGGTATSENTVNTVVKRDANGDFSAGTITANLAGNADTATTLETSRTIELTGDVTGSVSFDGSQNVQIQAVIDGSFATNSEVTSAIENAAGSYLDWDGQSQLNVNTQEIAQAFGQTFDSYGSASAAEAAANLYTDGRETAITTAYQNYADQAEVDAKAYTDTRETAITSAYQSYADTAEQDAKDYADDLINDASNLSTEVWSAYKTSTEIGLAQAAAEQHADEAVANIVGTMPAILDTIGELADALQDNPNVIDNLQTLAAGKQNTLTAGTGITLSNDEISVTVNTYDAYGAALDAQNAAALDATSKADDAQAAAATYTDGQITNLTTGGNGFTSLNIDDVVAQRAVLSEGLPAMLNEVFSWSASDFRSAKVLVKAANGVHTQISELMITLDTANNVAVSEYGITYSNGTELAAITADYLSGNVRILATPANSGADVMVLATLI